jgi:hypothetical protein
MAYRSRCLKASAEHGFEQVDGFSPNMGLSQVDKRRT